MINFPPGTSNEFLHDRAIRHALFVERLKTAEVRRLISFMNRQVLPAAETALLTRLARISQRGFDLGRVTTRRLADLVAAVNEILGKGVTEARGLFYERLVEIGAHEATWQIHSLEEATGPLAMDFTTPSRASIRSIITSRPMEGRVLKDWWKGVAKGAQLGIAKQINTGMALGETVDQMVRRITGTRATRYGTGEFAALRRKTAAVVRTSVNHINTHARELTYEANSDLMKGVQFVATLDSRTTEICMSLDGKVFPVGEGPRPPLHWNCLPGGSLVLSRSGIAAASERRFEGELVVIRTASGRELSCTPNHPVLTDRGWLPADALDVGSNVVCDGGREWRARVDGDGQDAPALIHDVAESFFSTLGVVTMPVPVAAEDFHGDGIDGQVAIVGAYRHLLDGGEAATPEQIAKPDVILGSTHLARLASLRGPAELLERIGPAALRLVGGLRQRLALLRRHARHAGELLFMPVAQRLAACPEYALHGVGGAAEVLGHPGNANAGMIEFQKLFDRQDHPRLEGARTRRDAALTKSPQDGIDADAELAAHVLSGATGPVFRDKVVEIDVREFGGHVYNLQTGAGFFAANGIITHNCRSATVPVLKSWKELGIPLRDAPPGTRASMNGQVPATMTYPEWLRKQTRGVQDDALGPTRAAMFRSGKVTIDKFVDARNNPLTLDQIRKREGLTAEDIAIRRRDSA